MDNATVNSTIKSQDTEEWQDIVFTRPLGLLMAKAYDHFDIHPNVVTVWGIFWGVIAGILMYWRTWPCTIAAILLLVWANLHDSADGQLARMTGKKSQIGRILDGLASDIWFLSIYVTIALRLTVQSGWGIWSWLLCSLAGFICHAKQCQLSDYYRNIHLFFLKGKSGSELDSGQAQREKFVQMPWKGHLIEKTFQYFYANYCSVQEKMTPQFQRFFAMVKEKYGDDIPQTLRDEFRKGSLPLMKWTNILTHNTRANVLFLSLIISMFTRPDLIWIYPTFEIIVLTALMFYMRWKHEKHCKRMEASLPTPLPSRERVIEEEDSPLKGDERGAS